LSERSNRAAVGTLQVVRVVAAARGVVKAYGEGRAAVRILDGLDFDLHAGELVAVTGRSGSGKSTLLNVIGALDRVDAGWVEVCGMRLDRASERELAPLRRDRIGFVFQAFHLLPELTGLENVLLPARLDGRRASLTRGVELVERLGLTAAAERLPAVLSGGEQQRLAIARALVNDPLLILADEPTGNLDTESGETVLELLRAIADEGRAVLLVTHEREATARADRVLRLEEGRLQ
jgi:ABC-type lipoprotein export system ATPase subunit